MRAEKRDGNETLKRAGTCLLSLTLWTTCSFATPDVQQLAARADDNNTSAYSKRLAESQKRKELLAQARQNALSKGALSDAIKSGEIEDPEVDTWSNLKTQMNPPVYVIAAANREVEATNARRQEESERALSAFRERASDTYSSQSSKGGPGLKGVAYDPKETPSAFSFSNKPEPLSVPKDTTPSTPETPSTVMNSSSESPFPSALAPSQPQGLKLEQEDISKYFEGLLETSKNATPAVPKQFSEPEEGRPSATVPPPRNTYDDPKPAPKVSEEAAPKAASKAAESASKAASEAPKAVSESATKAAFKATNNTPKATTKPFSEEYKNAKAVVQPEPIKEVSKDKGKRRGPLPLFLAQFLLLAAYGGGGFLAFKKDEETRKAVAIVSGLAQKGYSKVQELLPSGSK